MCDVFLFASLLFIFLLLSLSLSLSLGCAVCVVFSSVSHIHGCCFASLAPNTVPHALVRLLGCLVACFQVPALVAWGACCRPRSTRVLAYRRQRAHTRHPPPHPRLPGLADQGPAGVGREPCRALQGAAEAQGVCLSSQAHAQRVAPTH